MFYKIIQWLKSLFTQPALPPPPPVVIKPQPSEEIPDLPLPTTGGIKLGVIVGHTKESPGAALKGTGLYEYQFNTEIASLIKKHAPTWMQVETIFRDGVGISGAYLKAASIGCDVVIELHFNAYNGTVQGTETLCTQDSDDIEFAHLVQKAVSAVFERPGNSRGVKVISASARGGGNVHAFKQGPNCLIEPFFGDNDLEVIKALAKKDAYAKALVSAVVLYARKKDFLI